MRRPTSAAWRTRDHFRRRLEATLHLLDDLVDAEARWAVFCGCQRLAQRGQSMPSCATITRSPLRGDNGEISAGEFQDLSVGAARRDRAAREEGRVRVPPYRAGQPARLVSRHLAAPEGA